MTQPGLCALQHDTRCERHAPRARASRRDITAQNCDDRDCGQEDGAQRLGVPERVREFSHRASEFTPLRGSPSWQL